MIKKISVIIIILTTAVLYSSEFRRRKKNIFKAHWRSVTSVAFSPDSKYLASVSFDRRLKIWRVSSKRLVSRFFGHYNWIMQVKYSPNGKYLASGGMDKLVNLQSAKATRVLRGYDYGVNKIAFSKDSKYIYTFCYRSKTLLIHRTENGSLYKRIKFNTRHTLMCAGFSPDCKKVVLNEGTRISLWDLKTAKRIAVFKGGIHTAGVHSLEFSPDSKILVSGGGSTFDANDGTIKFWNVKTRKLVKSIKAHESDIFLSFTFDGKYLVSASKDRWIKIWRLKDFSLIKKISAKYESFWNVATSRDGKYVAAGTESGYIVILKTNNLGMY